MITAILYSVPFMITWLVPVLWFVCVYISWTTSFQIIPNAGSSLHEISNAYISIFVPLQGFFNWLVYIRPHLKKVMSKSKIMGASWWLETKEIVGSCCVFIFRGCEKTEDDDDGDCYAISSLERLDEEMIDIEDSENDIMSTKYYDENFLNASTNGRVKVNAESLSNDQNLSCKIEDHTSIARFIDAWDESAFSDETFFQDSHKDSSRFVSEADQVLNSVRDQLSSTHKDSGMLNNDDDGVKSTFSNDDEMGEEERKLESASKSLNCELTLTMY